MNEGAPKKIGKSARKKRVLLVEDDLVTAGAYTKLLRKEGFQVAHITSGREALDAIRDQNFDLVLLDLMLPEVDGIEILKRTHAQNKDFHTPVVVLSGADLNLVRE